MSGMLGLNSNDARACSVMSALQTCQRPMNAFGGVAALRDRRDGEVVAAENAVAAGPHPGERRAAFGIDLDASGFQRDRCAAAVECCRTSLARVWAGGDCI